MSATWRRRSRCCCETAREPGRAAQYYTRAAERASQVFAYDEAEALGHRGLAQVALLPEGAERIGLELGLSLSLGFTNLTRKGFAHPETAEHMNRAREICHMLGEIPPLAPVLFGLCLFHIASDRVQEGYDDAQRLLRLAEGTGEPAHRMIAHCAATGSLAHLGRPDESLEHFQRATEFFDPARRMEDRERFHSDPYLMAACEAVRDLWPMGRFDEARRMSERTIELARVTLDPRDRAFAGLFAARAAARDRKLRRGRAHLRRGNRAVRRVRYRIGTAMEPELPWRRSPASRSGRARPR